MSNAMRSGKRTLAAVAAGALAAGFMTFVALPSAQADTYTATPGPVRATGTTSPLTLPDAVMVWDATSGMATANVDLTTSPTVGAKMVVGSYYATLADDTDVSVVSPSGDDSGILFQVDTAGFYAGTIADGSDTVSFSFTTAGEPKSMVITPASQSVLVGGIADFSVSLLDANGNLTQPQTLDAIGVASSPHTAGDDTVAVTSISGSSMGLGSVDDSFVSSSAGTYTLTATPAGTLVGSGVTAVSATVTVGGTVNSTPATNAVVLTPTEQVPSPLYTADDTVDRTVAVPTGTSDVRVAFDDSTGNAVGSTMRFKVTPSAGTVTVDGETGSSSASIYVDVTTDSLRLGFIQMTLGGGAVGTGAYVTVKQVGVTNANLAGGTGLKVIQTDRAVSTSTITVSPDDSVVGKLGETIPVSVTVADQFGMAQAGWTVQSILGATTGGTFLNQATTNASGVASVAVVEPTGATTGTMQQYSFKAIASAGTVSVNNPLQVTWTTDGGITSLSVAVAGGASTPIADPAGTAPTTGPLLTVPYDGTADTGSTATYNLTTGVAGGTANGGDVVALTPTATPQNNVTASVPLGSTGVYVSTTASTAWDEGETSVTVSSGDPIYVFGTKAGTTSIELTSGGKTVAVDVKIQTATDAAYNIALSPESQPLKPGAIGNVTLTVTDVFGNPVTTADDTGKVTISASGDVLLAGFQPSDSFTTNASGEATVTVIAGNGGEGTLAAVPATGDAAPAWGSTYTPPTNAPAPVTSAAATVVVGTDPIEPTLFISAYRSGASNVVVDGDSDGFERRDVVILQTRTYNNKKGKWRPWKDRAEVLIKADGSFGGVINTTAKVRVRAISGDVKSNNLVVNK